MKGNIGEKQNQQKNVRGGASSKLYGLLRIVSSGASTVARSAANVVAQSIADRNDGTIGTGDSGPDQVLWAGFDRIEEDSNVFRQVLLLGYQSGFQVWDIEEADNVSALVSKHDGPASFLQMLPKPILSKKPGDKFLDSRPLLVVCGDGAFSGANINDGLDPSSNGNVSNYRDTGTGRSVPTVVRFYSLVSQSYVHMLKFRSVIYSVRCSPRVVAICQAAQIHCFNASTLERDYTIVTNPIVVGEPGSGGVGYGPLAIGPRWLAYSGNPVQGPSHSRVAPQHLATSSSFSGFSSNTNLVAHYAKESGKQLAAGIVTLGDMGYKKLSQYCSDLIPDSNSSGNSGWKLNGASNGQMPDVDNVGMVVVRDIITKHVLAQFRAHKSPISALCFDPTGILLVTASVQGHNINVFKVITGKSLSGDTGMSYVHLYRLQRGLTNAVIQDISFSDDSNWIMISSSRGTSHLFALNHFDACGANVSSLSGGMGLPHGRFQPNVYSHQNCTDPFTSGFPVTLSVVSRIRNGNNSWRGTVTGAAAAAAGRRSSLSGAIASSFHKCKGSFESFADGLTLKSNYHLLVFSPVGSLIQYSLRLQSGIDSTANESVVSSAFESDLESDGRLVVEAIQKWNIYQKKNRRDRDDNTDIYGNNAPLEGMKCFSRAKGKMNGGLIEDDVATFRQKNGFEEKHHLYIAEAELQMHPTIKPLWTRQQIYFQYIVKEAAIVNEEFPLNGEFEIERIPTRTVEARSKDLIPALDYIQAPKFQHSSQITKTYSSQKSNVSENGRIYSRNSTTSLDSLTGSTSAFDLRSQTEDSGRSSPIMPTEKKAFVNSFSNTDINTAPEIVNTSESVCSGDELKFVNNEYPILEKHAEDENGFD